LGRLPGFVAYVLLTTGEGQFAAVSVFEDEAGLKAATGLPALGQRLDRVRAPRPAGQSLIVCGEVLVQKGL
jgi:hypothetical protein